MTNETVLDVLKELGRGTYRDVAKHLKIEPVEALNMLREQRDQGRCDFSDGGWYLSGSGTGVPALRREKPEPVDPVILTGLLRNAGSMSTAEIASVMSRDARGMTATMNALARQGVVVKNGSGKGCTWSLPPAKEDPAESHTATGVKDSPIPATEPVSTCTEDVLKTIPALTEGSTSQFIFRLLTRGNQERRRIREDAARLDGVCDALRVLHRHQDLIQQLSEDEQP